MAFFLHLIYADPSSLSAVFLVAKKVIQYIHEPRLEFNHRRSQESKVFTGSVNIPQGFKAEGRELAQLRLNN
jgi:hypothetical protein